MNSATPKNTKVSVILAGPQTPRDTCQVSKLQERSQGLTTAGRIPNALGVPGQAGAGAIWGNRMQ